MYLPIFFTATTMETPKGCRKPRPILGTYQYDFELRPHTSLPICTVMGPDTGEIEFYMDLNGQWFADAPLSSWHFAVEGQDKTARYPVNADADYFRKEADLWENNIQDKAHVAKRINDVFERYRVLPDGRLIGKCDTLTVKTSWTVTRRDEQENGPKWEFDLLKEYPRSNNGCFPITCDPRAAMQGMYRIELPEMLRPSGYEHFEIEIYQAELINDTFNVWRDAAIAKREAERIDGLMRQYSGYQHKDMAEVLSLSGYSVVKL